MESRIVVVTVLLVLATWGLFRLVVVLKEGA